MKSLESLEPALVKKMYSELMKEETKPLFIYSFFLLDINMISIYSFLWVCVMISIFT